MMQRVNENCCSFWNCQLLVHGISLHSCISLRGCLKSCRPARAIKAGCCYSAALVQITKCRASGRTRGKEPELQGWLRTKITLWLLSFWNWELWCRKAVPKSCQFTTVQLSASLVITPQLREEHNRHVKRKEILQYSELAFGQLILKVIGGFAQLSNLPWVLTVIKTKTSRIKIDMEPLLIHIAED